MTPPQRILTVCLRGNSRSAALTWVLKEEMGRDAVAVGWSTAGPELMQTLCAWAQVVVVMESHMLERIPPPFRDKVKACDVGPDRWVNPSNPELQGIVRKWAKENL